jgi:hypothetical protein
MHEIALIGSHTGIGKQIRKHIDGTVNMCIPFDYEAWKRRPLIQKFLEWLLLPLRHLL